MSFFDEEETVVAEPPSLEADLQQLVGEATEALKAESLTDQEKRRLTNQIAAAQDELQIIRSQRARLALQTEADKTHKEYVEAPREEKKAALAKKSAARTALVAAGGVEHIGPTPWEQGEPTSVHFQQILSRAENGGIDRTVAYSIWKAQGYADNCPFTWDALNKFNDEICKRIHIGGKLSKVLDDRVESARIAAEGPKADQPTFNRAEAQPVQLLLDPETGEVLNTEACLRMLGAQEDFRVHDLETLNWYMKKRLQAVSEIEEISNNFKKALARPQQELRNLEFMFGCDAEQVAMELCEADQRKSKVLPFGTVKFVNRAPSWAIKDESELQLSIAALTDEQKAHIKATPKTWNRDLDTLKKENEAARAAGKPLPWAGLEYDKGGNKFYISQGSK